MCPPCGLCALYFVVLQLVHWWVEYAPGVEATLERCLSGPGLPPGCGKLGATLRGGGHLSWWRPPTHCRAAVANLWGASLALGVVLVGQLYLTLCDPTDYSLPSSSLCPWHSPSKEWVAIPFFRRSSQSRGWTQVSCIAGRFFTFWATGKSGPRPPKRCGKVGAVLRGAY